MSTLLIVLLILALFISLAAIAMTLWNLSQFAKPSVAALPKASQPLISVCIPARNEALNITACVQGVLASTHSNLEVLVYDDQSTDDTSQLVSALARADVRVRSVATVPLPTGWNGKQHACYRCALAARGEYLLFTDADVRCTADAIAAALNATANFTPEGAPRTKTLEELRAMHASSEPLVGQPRALVSTFPRQITKSLAEHLAVPMIFFILFSYLPFVRMRTTREVSSSAGCGQFLFVRSDAYRAAGTHEAFKNSMHDGIKMPRAVRGAGFMTGLFDGTDVCSCRMYFGFASTWRGFAKNAFEGLGSVGLLVFLTVMHAVGHVLPWGVVAAQLVRFVSQRTATSAATSVSVAVPQQVSSAAAALWEALHTPLALGLAIAACAAHLVQRGVLARRMQTSLVGACLHPLGVVMMTAIQWHSYVLHVTGKRSWRGRMAG